MLINNTIIASLGGILVIVALVLSMIVVRGENGYVYYAISSTMFALSMLLATAIAYSDRSVDGLSWLLFIVSFGTLAYAGYSAYILVPHDRE